MLEIDSVSLSFGNRAVLSGCYLNCHKGEVLGLLRRNGSGKSSLLKIIFGSLDADFKHLRLNGKIHKAGFGSQDIAYLPQDSCLPPFLETDTLIESFKGQLNVASMDAVSRLFGQNKRVGGLSSGMLRLLETLWVLHREASYILLDEPFSGLAPVHVELLQDVIREAGKKKGIILTDHIYQPLLEVANRIVLLHNNSVYAIKGRSDLVEFNYISAL